MTVAVEDTPAIAGDKPKPTAAEPLLTRHGGAVLWLPVLLLLLVSIVIVTVLVVTAGRSLDRSAAESARSLASAVLNDELQRIGQQALDYAWWDDLRTFAVEHQDTEWADQNIGAYINKTFGYAATFLIGGDDSTIMVFVDGKLVEPAGQDSLPAGLMRLVEKAREAPMDEPKQVQALMLVEGALQFVGGAAVTPEYPTPEQLEPKPRPVLLFSKKIDEAFLARTATTFGLPGLKLTETAPAETDVSLPLFDVMGNRVGWLSSRMPDAGRELVHTLVPALAVALTGVALLLGIFFIQVRRVASEQLAISRALQRERELVAMKSRLVHMFHHELGTPLTTIRAATDLLQRYNERLSEAERKEELTAIQREVEVIQAQLQDVLAAAGDGLPHSRYQPEDLKLAAFCNDIWRQAARQSKATHRLELQVAPDCQTGRLDPILLRTILVNLLSNAIRYSNPTRAVRLDVRREGAEIRFQVSDSGIGIPAADLDLVASPFHRGGNVGSLKGSGLGLAIVQRAVERHGGRLQIDSKEGVGTSVTAWLAASGGRHD